MMHGPKPSGEAQLAELYDLAEACLRGESGPEQVRRLEGLVLADAALRRELAGYLCASQSLRRLARADEGDPADLLLLRGVLANEDALVELAAPSRRSGVLGQAMRFITHPTPLSLLAASLFMAALLFALAMWALPGARSPVVAEVILARSVRWAPASYVDGHPPSGLSIGQNVELLQGTVALRFDGGALVLLEGPAKFAPQGHNELDLRRGRLVARVPPPAIGFLVRTPAVDVIDLGTEFSVEATEEETEVQVLAGNVQVRPRGAANHSAHRLTAGEAAVFGDSPSRGFYTQAKKTKRSIFVDMMAALASTGTGVAEAEWVLFRGAGYAPIAVKNQSFEDPNVGDNGWAPPHLPLDNASWNYASGDYRVHDPDGARFAGTGGDNANLQNVLPHGGQIFNLNSKWTTQTVGDVEPLAEYVLSFWIGTAADEGFNVPGAFEAVLMDDGVALATLAGDAPPPGTFKQFTLVGLAAAGASGEFSIGFRTTRSGPVWLDNVQLYRRALTAPAARHAQGNVLK